MQIVAGAAGRSVRGFGSRLRRARKSRRGKTIPTVFEIHGTDQALYALTGSPRLRLMIIPHNTRYAK